MDGFDDIDRDEYTEDAGYFGDEQPPSRAPRSNRGGDVVRGRTRALTATEGNARMHPPPGVNGLRDLSSNKWQDKHSPEGVEPYPNLLVSEPEPSLDDRLMAPPPDWAICCVCHEVSQSCTLIFI